MVKSLGGAWKTITPQSINEYPRQDLTLEIHAVRYYCTVPHAPRKLLPSWVILHGPIVMLTPAPVEYKRRQEADQRAFQQEQGQGADQRAF